ncbi:MFS transporter [Streptomyces sp. NPDC026672]|uniref:MFS transporter n=1 Tax=unclassified Streptomyces TaxID=2593676 RepID=UPI0033D47BCB
MTTPTPTTPVRGEAPPAPASRTRLTFLLLAVGTGSFAMLQSLVTPVLPVIQHDLHTTQSAVSWILIAWLLSASVATPILGRVGDMAGKERSLLLVLGAIVVGSLVAALSPNIGVMIVGRVIQGLGGAVYPLSFGIVRDEFPRERVPSAIGAMSGVIAVGGGLGTVLAGPVLDALGWRWLFWIPMIVVAVTAVLCRLFVPESPVRSGGRINWLSATLLSVWLLALLLPVSEGEQWGWASAPTVVLFVVAVAGFAVWVLVESRSSNPVIDMRMMRMPAVWTTNLVALFFGAGMFATLTFLPQLIQTPTSAGYGFGATVTEAGVLILPLLVTMAVSGVISGPIHRTVGFKAQVALGSALLSLACLGFALWHDGQGQVALASAVFGLGLGIAYAATTSLIVQNVAPAQTGVATGMNTNIRNIGGAIGTAIVSAVITSQVQSSGLPTEAAYRDGFLILAAISAAAVLVTALVPAARSTEEQPGRLSLN